VTQDEQLDAGKNNWLAALELQAHGVGVALLDVSTGEFMVASVANLSGLLSELARANPREVLVGGSLGSDAADPLPAIRAVLPRASLNPKRTPASENLQAFGALTEEAARLDPLARAAAARALEFARACNPRTELPVRRIGRFDPASALVIDAVAQRHLELVEASSGHAQESLLGVIDQTLTPLGARLLRRRLLAPLIDVERIRRRLDAVHAFVLHADLRERVRQHLPDVGDLERLAVRAALGEATPRDLGRLRDGLIAASDVAALMRAGLAQDFAHLVDSASEGWDPVSDLVTALSAALVERPPSELKEGAVFRSGYDPELDEWRRLRERSAELMAELEARLRAEVGIATLKVRYTRVFGWYIEISRAQAGKVPGTWRRKQTVASGERYTLPELDELADKILSAEEKQRERELELFHELVRSAGLASERTREVSRRIARWDVAQGLAELAHRHDYARPTVEVSEALEIQDGRHPVVEQHAALGRFVPNDAALDTAAERLWLVTGPNMAGKSTFLRQVALIVILAQLGSFVPARAARIGIVDRVLSRVGASDNLSRGESTFMVEMRETATILRDATRRSLVILDEIGRGTSTFDGLAIAWAVAEYLHDEVGCRALFATHYHELTELAEGTRSIANYSVSARELGGDVGFLHRVVRGAASQSYGVAVAKLAGLPERVLSRARARLGQLEGNALGGRPGNDPAANQLELFRPAALAKETLLVVETLRELDVDRLSGLDALKLLAQLKSKL
jgi:DNA mismatch repair protein MutS